MFQTLHGVTDHSDESSYLYGFTKLPLNSAPQAPKSQMLFYGRIIRLLTHPLFLDGFIIKVDKQLRDLI